MPEAPSMRIDDLARAAGVATTTVRLYQTKGLLPGPTVVGRTGYYDEHHLARLRLIQRLQAEGFSLAGIARVLESWEHGRDLDDLVGVERQLDVVLGARRGVTLSPADLTSRLPAEVLDPDVMQRAVDLGLVALTADGRVRVPDERFLDVGAAVAALGVPVSVILDEWAQLTAVTDEVAASFVDVFEEHLLPAPVDELDGDQIAALAATLDQLQRRAREILSVAFDASLARVAGERLRELLPEPQEATELT